MSSFLLDVNKFHSKLNSPSLVPEKCYRRNHLSYSMISYMNQIISLYLSENFDVIPIFIGRAYVEVEKNQHEDTKYYKEIAKNYLSCITKIIIEKELVSDERIRIIPDELKPSKPI